MTLVGLQDKIKSGGALLMCPVLGQLCHIENSSAMVRRVRYTAEPRRKGMCVHGSTAGVGGVGNAWNGLGGLILRTCGAVGIDMVVAHIKGCLTSFVKLPSTSR